MLALAAEDILLLEEVGVVEEDRVVPLVPPAVDGVEDRGELVQLVVHRTHLLEEDSDVDFREVCGRRLCAEVELVELRREVGRRRARDEEVEDIDRALLLATWVRVRVVGRLVLYLRKRGLLRVRVA